MKRWLLPYLCAALALLTVGLPLRTRLDAPRFGTPAVLRPGQSTEVEFVTSLPFVPWRVAATALERQWGFELERGGRRILSHRSQGNRHWITVADATPVEGFFRRPVDGLPIWGEGKLPDRLVLVHIADIPTSGKEAMMDRFVEAMARLKPHAVLASGDLIYDSSHSWYRFILSRFARIEAMGIPVIACAGNHEYGDWGRFLSYFGPITNHRRDLGPFRVLSLDTGHGIERLTPSQFRWFREEMEHLEGHVPIVQMHHPTFPPERVVSRDKGGESGGIFHGFRDPFVRLCLDHQVPVVLSGHWHQDAVFDGAGKMRDDRPDFPGTKFVTTTALGDATRHVSRWPLKYSGYRVLVFEGGKLVRYTEDAPGYASPSPFASTPLDGWAAVEVKR